MDDIDDIGVNLVLLKDKTKRKTKDKIMREIHKKRHQELAKHKDLSFQ